MTVIALDWNATRVRAVLGPAGEYPLPVPLEPPSCDLPLVISVERGTPVVGATGLRVCRHSAHMVCQSFLPFLTARPGPGPRWQVGNQSIDARQACELVWKKLQPVGQGVQGILMTVPGYLKPAQVDALYRLGEQLSLPVMGSAPTALAAAMAGHAEQFWQNSVLVLDVDDHALTLASVRAMGDKAHLIESRSFSHLGLRIWKERLINSLADAFVWQHRLDPRDAPLAEQSLFDQLDALIDAALHHRAIQLGVQSQQWFKHLLVHPEQTEMFCQGLVAQVARAAEEMMLDGAAETMPRGILLTNPAGRLPGLVAALQSVVRTAPRAGAALQAKQSFAPVDEDFGDELLFHDAVEELAGVLILPPEAPARSMHILADLFLKGALPRGHLETIAPLPAPQPVDAGPARLHFQGRDYLLRETSFALGSQYGCQLCFDRHEHPEVAPRHLEIVFEHRVFMLHQRSREATLVNDHPVTGAVTLHAGDRIRLGQHGPVVRFLGRALSRAAPAALV